MGLNSYYSKKKINKKRLEKIVKVVHVLILAGDTDGNLGDRAILQATCNKLKEVKQDIRITYLSGVPILDQKEIGFNPIPRGLKGIFCLIQNAVKCDFILCGGGGLFQDDDSLVKMPYWALRIFLIRLFCKKIFGYSLGVGPLTHPISRLFARIAFYCMERISVRDNEALQCAQKMTSKKIEVVPDPAIVLPVSNCNWKIFLQKKGIPSDKPIIGVAIRRSFNKTRSFIPNKYAYKYNLRRIPGIEKSQKMTSLVAYVLDRVIQEHNAFVLFLPTYNISHEADHIACMEVMKKMKSENKTILFISNPKCYKAIASNLAVMLGGRMHPTILSWSVGVPVVGLSYNQKFYGFFDLIGQRDRVMRIDHFVDYEKTDELVNMLSDAIKGNRISPLIVEKQSEVIANFIKSLF